MAPGAKSRGGPGAKPRGKPLAKGTTVGAETRWVPGKSGNPLGLPKEYAHVRDLARQYTGNAMKALVEIANDPYHQARPVAAKLILERAWGMPEQAIELSGKDGGPLTIAVDRLTDAELAAIEAIALKAAGQPAKPGDDSSGEGPEEAG